MSDNASTLGKSLVTQFCVLMKTAQLHDPANEALKKPVEDLCAVLQEIHGQKEEASLRVTRGLLHLGETKIKMDAEGFFSFGQVFNELRKRKIGSVNFSSPVIPEEIKKFVYLFLAIDSHNPAPFESLEEKVLSAGLTTIAIEKASEKEKEEIREVPADRKEMAVKTYFKTAEVARQVTEGIQTGQAVSLSKVKRLVQGMVDQISQEESALLGLTTLRSHDEYTYNHSMNVCILSMALGQRLGHEKKALSELGMSALFHDIGKLAIAAELLNKATEFTVEDWGIIRRHPVLGVRIILKQKGLNPTTVPLILGVLEHHLHCNLSGYPKIAGPRTLSLFGRIIAIADSYDALTSSRVYNRIAFSPNEALRHMWSKSGTEYDPVLLKIFITTMGIYPIGTVVLLDTGEVGVVFQANPDPARGDRPKVKLLTDGKGLPVEGHVVDLTEKGSAEASYRKSIVRTVDPRKYNLDVSRHFL